MYYTLCLSSISYYVFIWEQIWLPQSSHCDKQNIDPGWSLSMMASNIHLQLRTAGLYLPDRIYRISLWDRFRCLCSSSLSMLSRGAVCRQSSSCWSHRLQVCLLANLLPFNFPIIEFTRPSDLLFADVLCDMTAYSGFRNPRFSMHITIFWPYSSRFWLYLT